MKKYVNFTTSLGFSQLVKHPTRVINTCSLLIDHIYTNYEETISKVHVCKQTLSDHLDIEN